MKAYILASSLALLSGVSGRTMTVYNACPFTIWPAMFTDLNVPGNTAPSFTTGWSAASFTAVTFDLPNNWQAGRIWARRDCDFSTNPGPNSCLDGGCNGGLVCDPHTGTGVPPASLAEFTLSGAGNKDYYDVSLVDGYNLPIRVDNNVGCPIPKCAVDLGPNCPAPLKGPFDSTGFPVGCKSACIANLSGIQPTPRIAARGPLTHLLRVQVPALLITVTSRMPALTHTLTHMTNPVVRYLEL
ncbi:thaumatin family-domain-containing protein [Gymnopilus junonius]|uniref:Thaumatin family-domain-containing protein n=1 Tax=Gymnopilus junonius TaxID=109634 RepID=A0A9P5NZV7_GYMJU|nr:thaumatin family-domain-containing protein [Gymnopilus junonius]